MTDPFGDAIADAIRRRDVPAVFGTVDEIAAHLERTKPDEHCGYTPANCPWGDACADCGANGSQVNREDT